MRKRLFALLCALALILGLKAPVSAAGDVCFTAINDTVLSLTADSMPVWSGGTLYVPYTVFDAGTTGVSLGISATYGKSSGIVSIFNIQEMLVFDLKQSVCRNQHTGEVLFGQAIIRNGRPYVPAARVCSFFGLQPPSYLSTDYGPLVRIKNDEVRMMDGPFAVAASASNVLSNRLRDYNQSLSPDPSSGGSAQKPSPETAEPTAVSTYLAFRCQTGESGSTIADILEYNRISAVFFFSPEEIGRQGPLVRRLLGQGHSIGILALGSTPKDTRSLLTLGSEILAAVAHTRTHYALVSPEQIPELEGGGWLFWDSTLDATPDGSRSSYSQAYRCVSSLPKRGTASLILDDSALSADVMRHLPYLLRERKYTVSIPRETRM